MTTTPAPLTPATPRPGLFHTLGTRLRSALRAACNRPGTVDFVQVLRQHREAAGISTKEAADRMQLTITQYLKIEERSTAPSYAERYGLLTRLDMPAADAHHIAAHPAVMAYYHRVALNRTFGIVTQIICLPLLLSFVANRPLYNFALPLILTAITVGFIPAIRDFCKGFARGA